MNEKEVLSSHQAASDAEAYYNRAISDVLAILTPNWNIDRQTFRCNRETRTDRNGNDQFFASVEIEAALSEHIAAIRALSLPKAGEGEA